MVMAQRAYEDGDGYSDLPGQSFCKKRPFAVASM
jgi:hypothetical protein